MPKLIVRTPNHLGDSIMSLSAIGALRGLFKDSSIHVLAPEFVSGLFKRHPALDEVHTLPAGAQHGFKSIGATKSALEKAGGGFEIGILLTDSLSSAGAFKFAGVTNIFGFSGNGRSALLRAALAAPDQRTARIHRSIMYQRLASFSAEKFWANPYWVKDVSFERPEIYFSEAERSSARGILERAGVDLNEGFVAISPRAVAESRRWGVEKYAELSGRIISELSLPIVLIGSSDDREAAQYICENIGERAINLCGSAKVRGSAAILSQASAFVGNDSGVGHLAALVNCPLVILSGADNPAVTSPLSQNKSVIIRSDLDCISCVRNKCPKTGDGFMRCMGEISVAEVFTQLKGRLARP